MAETPAQRLKKIREERFPTAAEAQRAIGVKYATYAAHENGSRDISRKFAIRYASFFKIRLDWLLTGSGEPRSAGAVQRLFDELPAEMQAEALRYLEYLKTRRNTSLSPRASPAVALIDEHNGPAEGGQGNRHDHKGK
jgi:DNA-binding XRE family transcriptional regulator